jgi:hypothetical protein
VKVALELLTVEHERLLVDHYDDGTPTSCDGCQRVAEVRREIESLTLEGVEDLLKRCAACDAPMYTVVRGHHHAENGKDVTS